MFTNQSWNCIPGCNLDTTPCTTNLQGEYNNYPAYGLEGISYEGFSYLSDSGAAMIYKPSDDGKFYIDDQIPVFTHDGEAIPMFKALLDTPSSLPQLLFDQTAIENMYDLDKAAAGLPSSLPTFKTIKDIKVGLGRDGVSFVWAEYAPERPVMYIYKTVKEITADSVNVKYYLADKRGLPINFEDPKYKDLVVINSRLRIMRHDPAEVQDIENCGSYACCADLIVRPVVAMGEDQLSRPSNFGGMAAYPYVVFEGAGNGTDGVNRPLFTVTGRSSVEGSTVSYNDNYTCLNNPDKYTDGIYPGDQVTFEYNSFDRCNPVMGGYQEQGYVVRKSYAQNIGTELCFSAQELSMGYPEIGGIDVVIGHRLQNIARDLTEQEYRAFWLGENRRPNNASKIPGSTMGLLTELLNAHAQKPWLRIIRSAANAITLEEKARLFIEVLSEAQNAKFGRGNITCVMDSAAYNCFLALRPAFQSLGGWCCEQHSGDNFDLGRKFTVTTQFGGVELMTDTYLQQISENSGICIFLNRDLIGSATLPEFSIELPSNQVKKNVSQGLKVADVSDPKMLGKCKCFYVYTSFGFVFVGIGNENAPYRILEGFSL